MALPTSRALTAKRGGLSCGVRGVPGTGPRILKKPAERSEATPRGAPTRPTDDEGTEEEGVSLLGEKGLEREVGGFLQTKTRRTKAQLDPKLRFGSSVLWYGFCLHLTSPPPSDRTDPFSQECLLL